jgi:hypothetical protein
VESDVEAPCSASGKRGPISGKSSISCHPSELQGRAGVVESMAVSGLSKGPAPGTAALSARRALSLTSASEALESPSPCRTIGSSIPCQQNWPSISTTEGSGRAHLGCRQSYRLVLTRGGQWHRPSHLQLPPQLLAPCGLGWGQLLQSPALVAWRAAVFRRWEGRGRRR